MPGQTWSTMRRRPLWIWPPTHNVPLCWRGNWEEVSHKASSFSYLLQMSLPVRVSHLTVSLLHLQWFCAPTVTPRSISMMKTPTERRAALMKSIHSNKKPSQHVYRSDICGRNIIYKGGEDMKAGCRCLIVSTFFFIPVHCKNIAVLLFCTCLGWTQWTFVLLFAALLLTVFIA